MSGSVECFKLCKQLNELDITYDKLREDFFTNIASFVPNLKYLWIERDKQFSNSFIDSFHLIKNIQKVKFSLKNHSYSNIELYKKWYFGKCVSEVMLSHNGMNVKHITHNCGLINCYSDV